MKSIHSPAQLHKNSSKSANKPNTLSFLSAQTIASMGNSASCARGGSSVDAHTRSSLIDQSSPISENLSQNSKSTRRQKQQSLLPRSQSQPARHRSSQRSSANKNNTKDQSLRAGGEMYMSPKFSSNPVDSTHKYNAEKASSSLSTDMPFAKAGSAHLDEHKIEHAHTKRPLPDRRQLKKKVTDTLTVANHVWKYINRFNQHEMTEVCKYSELHVTMVPAKTNTVDREPDVTLEFTAESSGKLQKALNIFIPLYQQISQEIISNMYDMKSAQGRKVASHLEDRFQCVVCLIDQGSLQVTCKITDSHNIRLALSVYTTLKDTTTTMRDINKLTSCNRGTPSAILSAGMSSTSTNAAISEINKTDVSPPDRPSLKTQPPVAVGYQMNDGTKLLIHQCDITAMVVDVVVSPANVHLQSVGGLSQVIAERAGPLLKQACERVIAEKGLLKVCDVEATLAAQMPAKMVYHACGPRWPSVEDLYDQQRCYSQLQMTLFRIIELARSQRVQSIAIPPLSSGINGVPAAHVAESIFKVILEARTGINTLCEIHIVDIMPDLLVLLKSKFDRLVMDGTGTSTMTSADVRNVVEKRLQSPDKDFHSAHPSLSSIILPLQGPERTVSKGADRYNEEISALSLKIGFTPIGFVVHDTIEVFIHKCDITRLRVDAIVNAANVYLDNAGGLSKIIAKSAGIKLVEDCESIRSHGTLNLTQVVCTRAGDLPCALVYHAVGPSWPKKIDSSKEKDCIESLETTFCNIFKTVQNDDITSLACPAISSGVYRVPIQYVAKAMCEGILNVVNPGCKLHEIHLVDVADVTLQAIVDAFQSALSSGYLSRLAGQHVEMIIRKRMLGDSPVSTTAKANRKHSRIGKYDEKSLKGDDSFNYKSEHWTPDKFEPIGFQCNDHKTKIYIHNCDITCMKVDAVVNAANTKLKNFGGIAECIAHVAGKEMEDACRCIMSKYGTLKHGDVVRTSAGNLPANIVLHAVGPVWPKDGNSLKKNDCLKLLRETFHKILQQTKRYDLTSIAIPAVSSGIFGVPGEKVAEVMCEQILHGISGCSSLMEVHLVDTSIYMLKLIETKLKTKNMSQLDKKQVLDKITAMTISHKSSVSVGSPSIGDAPRNVASYTQPSKISILTSQNKSSEYHTKMGGMSVLPTVENSSKYVRILDEIPNSNLPVGKYMDVRPKEHISVTCEPKERTEFETCVICLNDIEKPKILSKCKHKFCADCIDHMFTNYQPKCPSCGTMYGLEKGSQPNGKMTHTMLPTSLPGHEGHQTIMISYSFPSGIQGDEHPNPGHPYSGTSRTAYLPDTREGRGVLKLLKQAFNARLVFTIGRSVTTGADNVVTWNDIHHKTSTHGGPTAFGYPDSTYLNRVKEELAAKGVL